MAEPSQPKAVRRLLIVMPTWLGDCVMAMPTVRALRELYPDAHVAALLRRNVRPVLEDCPWVDRILTTRPRRRGMPDRRRGPMALSRRVSQGRFDMAVLLPNSFRSAMTVTLAGIPRRVGYDRDGRGWMLTDRLLPRRKPGGEFYPVPTREYYLGLARYLGASDPDPAMRLFTSPADDARADAVLSQAGYEGQRPLVLLNPGANKPEKRWPPERFAELADRLTRDSGVVVAVTGSPGERDVLDAVTSRATLPILDLTRHGLDLTLLKSVVRRAALLVTNDTGPRHIAAALDTSVVTLFGPTPPAWTEIGFEHERQIVTDERCPACADTVAACMHTIPVDRVLAAANDLLRSARPQSAPAAG